MNLRQLKNLLESQPAEKVCKYGFGYPHAHRGFYNHVSFPPNEPNVSIGQMLEYVDAALNHTFTGWKGGEYEYNQMTPVHFNFEGVCSTDDDADRTIPDNVLSSILD